MTPDSRRAQIPFPLLLKPHVSCSSKWKQQNLLEQALVEKDDLLIDLREVLCKFKAPPCWKMGLSFWGVCLQRLIFHKCFQITKPSLSFEIVWLEACLHPHICCQDSECAGITFRDSVGDRGEIWFPLSFTSFLTWMPLSGLFSVLIHQTWYKMSVGFSRNQNFFTQIGVLPFWQDLMEYTKTFQASSKGEF